MIMDKAIPFIEKAAEDEKPFFAVIWFHAPHEPVTGHPEYMKELYAGRPAEEQHYFSVVTALDAQVGRLREKLQELNISENTLLCFTSDNGPAGNPDKGDLSRGSAGEYRGRKGNLYEGGIRVPGIIEFPAKFKGGRVIETPCVTSDYFPTIVELLGYKPEDNLRPYDGISLIPFLKGETTMRNNPIGFQKGNQKVWTDDRYKLIHNLSGERHRSDNGIVPLAEFELYDLVIDPGETRNIAAEYPSITEKMKNELTDFVLSCEQSLAGADYH
jgi:arylsulfatase A-like enzyme